MRLLFDIETDELDRRDGQIHTTKLHSLVVKDLDTGAVLSCTDADPRYAPIQDGLDLLDKAEALYGHNIINFDIPVLEHHTGWAPGREVRRIDTLVLAQARFAHIKQIDFPLSRQGRLPPRLIGSHGLEAWGYRLGSRKLKFDGPWEEWSEEMQTYCEGDLETNEALIRHLRKYRLPGETAEMELWLRDYLRIQTENGWPLDMDAVIELNSRLADQVETIREQLVAEYGSWFEPNGDVVTPKRSMTRRKGFKVPQEITEGCPYQKIKLVEFNPDSRQHCAKMLMERHGWEPTVFTDTGSPKLDETILKGLEEEVSNADTLLRYFRAKKTLGQISGGKKSWLACSTTESPPAKKFNMRFTHHECNQNRAVTHRAGHKEPNVAQVPKVGRPYGKECRSCWVVPPGWKLVGADISSLELIMMGHYMHPFDGGRYGEAVVSGDPHELTREALGFEGESGRDAAKTVMYATIYGAGDEKRGKIKVKWGLSNASGERALRREGRDLKQRLATNLTGFGQLEEVVKHQYKQKGRLLLLDGRPVYPRAEHAALNALFQGSGAIVCKFWIWEFGRALWDKLGAPGWDGLWTPLGWIHDEVQIAVKEGHEQEVTSELVAAVGRAGERLEVRFPLTGDSHIGDNWAETH